MKLYDLTNSELTSCIYASPLGMLLAPSKIKIIKQ